MPSEGHMEQGQTAVFLRIFFPLFLSWGFVAWVTFEAFCCDMFLALFFFDERQNSCPLGSTKKISLEVLNNLFMKRNKL